MNMIRFILNYFKNLKFKIIIYLFTAIFQWGSLLLIPVLISKYIDRLFYDKINDQKLILEFIVITLIWAASSYLMSFLLNLLGNYLAHDIQIDAFKHIRKAKLNEINVDNPTIMTSKINNGAFLIPSFFLNTGVEAILSIIGLIVILVVMAYINKLVLLTTVFILILNLVVVKLFKNKLNEVNYKLQERQNIFFASLNNQITNIKLIKTNVWFNEVEKELDNSFDKLKISFMKKINIDISYNVLIGSFKYISTLAILLIVSNGIEKGNTSVGDFQLIYSYSNIALGYLATVMGIIPSYHEIISYYSRFKEVLDIPKENNGDLIINEINTITVNNLSFAYDNKNYILENITTKFEKGKLYILKGCNGRGKSTFLNIVLGLYEDYYGEILYNNYSIKNIDLYDTRKKLVCKVEQEPKLINTSVLENIIYGNLNYDKDYLSYLIDKFDIPNLDIIIDSKSDNISGGQKQKISIIRSLLKLHNTNNSLLILDEPSSALDKKGRELLVEEIAELKENNIIIVISHDELFEKVCDEIVVL